MKNQTRRAEARSKPKPVPRTPAFLAAAFRRDARAHAGFKGLTPGRQREYIEWLNEARTDATREKRLARALEQMADGKGLNWQYAKKK